MLWEFEPASGSVMPNAMMVSPSAMPGSQRCFCSSVPKRLMIVPQIAGDTTIISRPQPAALSSSPDDGELVHAGAAAAVLLGQVDADEAAACRPRPTARSAARAAVTRGAVYSWP